VRVEEGISSYVVGVIRRTRQMPNIAWGASPRASVALLMCAKALAAIRGRDFVVPDDVKEIATPVLRHRVVLRSEAEIEGVTPDQAITAAIAQVEVPR
jgi:MoxR-like ATPase